MSENEERGAYWETDAEGRVGLSKLGQEAWTAAAPAPAGGDDREALMLVMERAHAAAVRDGRIPTRGTDEYFLILADALIAARRSPAQQVDAATVELLARHNYEFQNPAGPEWGTRAEWLRQGYRDEARSGLIALAALRPTAAPLVDAETAWDEGRHAADMEWEQLFDLATPDEDRFVAVNPYAALRSPVGNKL